MSASGNRINYNIRTAKSIERKMILNIVKEIFKYHDISRCRYIGMGSTYFADFKLFHRELHINNMISFEMEDSLMPRVDFNKPYKCINVLPGKSTELLEDIWDENLIDFLWMDYDNELEYDYFNDVELIFSNIQPGGIYLMSCNRGLKNHSMTSFKEKFGELAPLDISMDDLSGNKDYITIHRMLTNKINEVLTQRNYLLSDEDKLVFRQLFFFTYKDGAPMISFGGLIDKVNSGFTLEKYNLQYFDFVMTSNDRYTIDPPLLSYKEVLLLNAFLPDSEDVIGLLPEINFIPRSDLNRYRKFYKYLPNYMDVIF
jgi:hypothetical protein